MLSINKEKKISVIISLTVIAVVTIVIFGIYVGNFTSQANEKISKGPFHLDKSTYRVGESVIIRAEGIKADDKGIIYFKDPNNKIFREIEFDGSKNIYQNAFVKLVSTTDKNCYSCDLIGTWTMEYRMLKGPPYQTETFEVTE